MNKVSIIIPTYNRAHFIKKAIDSILKQNYQNFEIIVVDDGSTDNTRDLIGSIIKKDNRVKYFYKDNGGLSSARNEGVRRATGDYIALLDSDDYSYEHRLQDQVKILDSRQDVDFVYSRVVLDENQPEGWGRIFPFTKDKKQMFKTVLAVAVFSVPSTWMMRRGMAEDIKYNENIRFEEDFCFLLEATQKYNFYGLDKPVTFMTRGHESIFSNRTEPIRVRKEVLKFIYRKKDGNINMTLFMYLWALSQMHLRNARFDCRKYSKDYVVCMLKAFLWFPLNIYIYKYIVSGVISRKPFSLRESIRG